MKILVVIDMQNDFIDGVLGTKEAVGIVENVKAKIKYYLDKGDKVVFTQDTHSENYLETQEGQKLPVVHCVKGTRGWDISSEVFVEGCPVIEKPSFGSEELAQYIRSLQEIESIELIGVCTDICVISNALILKANFPELPVTVDASCCAGVTPESHRNAIQAMKMCQVNILNE